MLSPLLALTLLAPGPSGPTCNAYQAAASDIDHDGRYEFAVACNGQPDLLVGFRDGTLTTIWSAPESNAQSRGVTWGDFDDDGDADLATCGYGEPTRVYGTDRGQLTLVWSSSQPLPSKDCEFADIDGDSDVDLVVAGEGADAIFINEDGSFGEPRRVFLGDQTDDVALHDFDEDGDLDLAAAVAGKSSDILFRNEGGSFLRHWSTPSASPGSAVAWGDVDNDRRPDLAIARPDGPDELWRQTESGEFERVPWNVGTQHSREIAWEDIDRDQWDELFVGWEAPLVIHHNDQGQLSAGDALPGATALIEAIAFADADGDGRVDLLVGGRTPDVELALGEPGGLPLRLYLAGEEQAAPVGRAPVPRQEEEEDLLAPAAPDRRPKEKAPLGKRMISLLIKAILLGVILLGGYRASLWARSLDKKRPG